jgi:hypothetical protein
MAKQERQGRQFTKCDAFWDAQVGESFTGVLIDCNERFPDAMKGKNAVKPLYIFKSLGAKGEAPTLNLEDDKGNKKKVPNKKGLIVGVFDCGELHDKIFAKYEETVGRDATITYEKKEPFTTKDGAQQTIKRMKVLVDDAPHAEFGGDVVKAKLDGTGAGAATQAPINGGGGSTGPFKMEDESA